MNDTSIACFLSIARTGSFTASAKELSSTQQAVSRNVQSLEEELGFSLLDRNGRSVELTWEGVRYYRWCLEYDRQIVLATDTASRLMGNVVNTLRIGWCDWTGCPQELAEDIRSFADNYSACTLDFRQAAVTDIQSALQEGRLDIAFLPEYCTHNLSGLIISPPFMSLPLYAVTSAQYSFRSECPTAAELTPMKNLSAHFGSDTDEQVQDRARFLCSNIGIYPEHIEIKPNVLSTYAELDCGPCYTISPRTSCAERRGSLRFHTLNASIPLVFARPNQDCIPWVPLFETFLRQRREQA